MNGGPCDGLTDYGVDAIVDAERAGEPHPWAPIALDPTIEPPLPPSILVAEDGQGALIYPGKRHLLFGETEALKSWVCAVAAVEQALAGLDTVWIDADRMGRAALVERLRALGLSDDLILGHIHYLSPDMALDAEGTLHLVHVLDGLNVALVVIDAHDPALELQGLDPNSTADVQHFSRVVVDVFHRRGIATLVPDHVARSGDGKNPIASQRKVSGFDVAIRIKLIGEPMTRTQPTATVELFGRKDRPGWHDRHGLDRRIGEIHFDLRATPAWSLVFGGGDEAERVRIPTVLMQRVSMFLEMRSEPACMTAIVDSVAGKASGIRWAVDVLRKMGHIEAHPGRRKGDLVYLSTRPFREGDENEPVPEPVPPKTDEPVPTRPRTRPSENPAAMRGLANPSQPVPNPSPSSPVNPSPIITPLQGVMGGTGSLERCSTCGKRGVQTESGEAICRCGETIRQDHDGHKMREEAS